MLRPVDLSAEGFIRYAGQVGPGKVAVTAGGLSLELASGVKIEKAAWEISGLRRTGYAITVVLVGGETPTFERFGRRTDELETALWRCRSDAIAELMAPAGATPLEVVSARAETPGRLYRYEDGLRWVPQEGPCLARLYGELEGAKFDEQAYALTLWGPFGHAQLRGLARRTSEVEQEVRRRVTEAKDTLSRRLRELGLRWRDDIGTGAVRQHVPFRATEARLEALQTATGLIAEERREYWDSLREDDLIARLVISSDEQGDLRLVALCPVGSGELYEVLSEADHASFVFRRADPVVRAWTEVGFRREPIFEEEAGSSGAYAALAELLPSLAEARASLVRRVVPDSVDQWRSALS